MLRLWFVYSTISRYFDNNWNLPAASKFPRRAVQTSFQLLQSPPLPQKWPLVSLSLSSFQIFQKYFSFFVLLKTVSKPTPKSLFNSFFQFPFTFLQFFPPNHSNLKLQLSTIPLSFSQKYSTPFNLFKLSQTSNPFSRMIKKIAFPIKKKKGKSSRLLSSIKSLLKIFTEITLDRRRGAYTASFGLRTLVRSFSMHAAGRVRQRGAGRRECDYCNFDEIRATWHERVCPW